jgi:hypothetical protein
MKEPLPPKAKATAPRKDPPAARPSSRFERQLRVRFYCSMRAQRVHSLLVEVQQPREGSGASTPVVVRPVIPGALVAPAEQTLDAGQPNPQARFQVTPLARGRLPEARVEVYQHGRLADQVRLRMKAFTPRRTWVLLLLAILVPWFLLAVTTDTTWPFWKLHGKIPGKPPELTADPGELLEYRLLTWTEANVPNIPQSREYVINPAAGGLRFAYNWACSLAPDHLAFWVGVALLGLTIASWIGNRRQRTSRRKPLQLAAGVPLAEAAETLPLTAREQAPVGAPPAP